MKDLYKNYFFYVGIVFLSRNVPNNNYCAGVPKLINEGTYPIPKLNVNLIYIYFRVAQI